MAFKGNISTKFVHNSEASVLYNGLLGKYAWCTHIDYALTCPGY